jgi:hypothetical protein
MRSRNVTRVIYRFATRSNRKATEGESAHALVFVRPVFTQMQGRFPIDCLSKSGLLPCGRSLIPGIHAVPRHTNWPDIVA